MTVDGYFTLNCLERGVNANYIKQRLYSYIIYFLYADKKNKINASSDFHQQVAKKWTGGFLFKNKHEKLLKTKITYTNNHVQQNMTALT